MSNVSSELVADAPIVSKSERAYRWIRQRIATRAFAPGYRLVLASLADELDMSVVPVREAIRRLEAEGLVTFERNVGAQVAMIDRDAYRHSMQALSLMESAAVALAAPHLTAAQLRRARTINERMGTGLDPFDPHRFAELNHEFHFVLYRRCPNPRLRELVDAEWSRLGKMRDSIFAFVPDRACQSVREHDAIVDLIERQAPFVEIEQAMRRHRTATLRAFLEHGDDHPAGPGRRSSIKEEV